MIALKRMLTLDTVWRVLIVAGLSVVTLTCKYPTGPVKGNTVPGTRLANVPANDTIAKYINRNAFPELSLSWVGDDPDGYVIGFQYRWTSTTYGRPFPVPGNWNTILNITKSNWTNVVLLRGNPASIFRVYDFLATLGRSVPDSTIIRIVGDSLATLRPFAVPYRDGAIVTDSIVGAPLLVLQTPTRGTFIFDSPADSNFHRFEVRAVDNSDAVDPEPATVYFWTLVSPGSIVTYDVVPTQNALCISRITDTFLGLRFAFRAIDPNNSLGFEFSWSVDDTLHWTGWSSSQEAFVTAAHFQPQPPTPGLATHTFHVRARNRWGVISPDSVRNFTASVPRINDPAWPKRTLIINDDLNGTGARGRPTLNQTDSLYREIMDSIGMGGRFDIWRVADPAHLNQWPSRDSLGYYTSVLVLMEQRIPAIGQGSQQRLASQQQGWLREYLNVGGNLIWSGTPHAAAGIFNFLPPNNATGWGTTVFHIAPNTSQTPYLLSQVFDFNGVRGDVGLGYPDVVLDTNKIAPFSSDSLGAVANIGNIGINFPISFAENFSFFRSRFGTYYETLPVGIRFLAPDPLPGDPRTYSVVYFGFGLCYGQKSAVIQSLRRAFQDIHELPR